MALKELNRREYERLNHCVFSDAEWQRIESERPADGLPVATTNGLELARYAMPNGAHFVTLKDGSGETWEAYCESLKRKGACVNDAEWIEEKIERMGTVQAIEFLDGLLLASDEQKRPVIISTRDRLQRNLNEWAKLQPMGAQ